MTDIHVAVIYFKGVKYKIARCQICIGDGKVVFHDIASLSRGSICTVILQEIPSWLYTQ